MANNVTNIAGVLTAITGTVVFGNATAVTIGTIPANSQIVNAHIDTTTAFNAGTTNTMIIGNSGTAAAYVASTAVGSLGRASVATTGVYSAWPTVGASDVTVTATFAQTGTAATTGAATVTIVYKSYAQ